MELYGRDYGFKLTVGGMADIADLCPDGDITKIQSLFDGRYSKITKKGIAFICILSTGYEEARGFEDPDYKPTPLTPALVRSLAPAEFAALQKEAMAAFGQDAKPSVEVDTTAKKNEGAALE